MQYFQEISTFPFIPWATNHSHNQKSRRSMKEKSKSTPKVTLNQNQEKISRYSASSTKVRRYYSGVELPEYYEDINGNIYGSAIMPIKLFQKSKMSKMVKIFEELDLPTEHIKKIPYDGINSINGNGRELRRAKVVVSSVVNSVVNLILQKWKLVRNYYYYYYYSYVFIYLWWCRSFPYSLTGLWVLYLHNTHPYTVM